MKSTLRPTHWMIFVLMALALSACATVPTADGEVQTYSKLGTAVGPASYRFDVLPSHEDAGKRRAEVEAMAERALTKVGLTRNDTQPRFSVQVGVRVQREDRLDWPDNWHYGWGRFGPQYFGLSPRGNPWWWLHSSPWFQREISLTLRELSTGLVVYETHARQEGVGGSTNRLLEAMFDAAVAHFPASTGPSARKVVLQLPEQP